MLNTLDRSPSEPPRSASARPRNIAIVGATGAVGVELLSCLETRGFPVGTLHLLASPRSAGKTLRFRGEDLPFPIGPWSPALAVWLG